MDRDIFESRAVLPPCGAEDLLLVLGPGRKVLVPRHSDSPLTASLLNTLLVWEKFGLDQGRVLPAGLLNGRAVYGVYLGASEVEALVAQGAVLIDVRKHYQDGGTLSFELLNRVLHGGQWHEESRFCPSCNGPTAWKAGEFAKECTLCGFVQYPRINPAVIMAVLDGDHILLAKNAQSSFPFWSLLAGYVEIGESMEQAVVREVLEESGLHVEQVEYVASQPWAFSQSLMIGYTCRLCPGVQRSDLNIDLHELAEAAWFPLTDLPEHAPYPSMAWYLIKHVVQKNKPAGQGGSNTEE